eukprot:6950925-Karenia_brevis.AAC.1
MDLQRLCLDTRIRGHGYLDLQEGDMGRLQHRGLHLLSNCHAGSRPPGSGRSQGNLAIDPRL